MFSTPGTCLGNQMDVKPCMAKSRELLGFDLCTNLGRTVWVHLCIHFLLTFAGAPGNRHLKTAAASPYVRSNWYEYYQVWHSPDFCLLVAIDRLVLASLISLGRFLETFLSKSLGCIPRASHSCWKLIESFNGKRSTSEPQTNQSFAGIANPAFSSSANISAAGEVSRTLEFHKKPNTRFMCTPLSRSYWNPLEILRRRFSRTACKWGTIECSLGYEEEETLTVGITELPKFGLETGPLWMIFASLHFYGNICGPSHYMRIISPQASLVVEVVWAHFWQGSELDHGLFVLLGAILYMPALHSRFPFGNYQSAWTYHYQYTALANSLSDEHAILSS